MKTRNLKEIHRECFMGESNYIPLAVKISSDRMNDFTMWNGMKNPQITIDNFIEKNEASLKIKSDWIPVLESNFMESLIPSIFGAEIYQSPGGLIDIKAFINDIHEIESLKVTDIFSGQTEEAIRHLQYLKSNTIENINVIMSRFASPLDYAVMMRGGDFYMDLLLEPELAMKFMEKIMEVTISIIKLFKNELNEPLESQLTVRGFHYPGLRLTGDAIVNLSPSLIREFLFPVYDRFAKEFGSVMLHYCTTPAPSGHVLPVLTECSGIRCVDNWQGYRTFFNENEDGLLQEKVSVCTDLIIEQVENVDKLMQGEPFFAKVPRKCGRGIAASVIAENIEQGKRLYYNWVNYFEKNK
ncbi:MAG: uroporphyrinogen decarboxylase/cobalamine-independent methonine synthase family protein [Saccharofermentanales bacterium]